MSNNNTQPTEERLQEMAEALSNLIFTAQKLWDEVKIIKDTEAMTVTHPVIEEARITLAGAKAILSLQQEGGGVKSKQQCYEEATLKNLANFPNGTRMDVIYLAMDIYHNQFTPSVHKEGDGIFKLITDEMRRQYSAEGYDEKHDDAHDGSELSLAAACYAAFPINLYTHDHSLLHKQVFNRLIPFDEYEIEEKHSEERRLIIAAALIIQEIKRLKRKPKNNINED